MAVVIRLTKTGRKGERKYRIIVKEKRSKRDGRAIEILGRYEKREKEVIKKINMDRYKYWLSVGAKPTVSVANILKQ
ncbi:MAG: 30S ribosomal protein S16 [Candidatus Levybacteria bacterium RIFCSPLOWO2_02_FULL_37_10]|nr:MAG: 30S ribosomal protein S16 [Candidatus Levybacteria bacterium RIFCSPHIGHO2_01_FULL_37_33]OGH17635.1 MAG: 30S ribosomal protein S16 [Candidatus Levybacteria bacterium RIFCSPHIGHO2_02_FULL_37_11]OGH29322.1 MAG: 30S ribosomal protein S16 [Candidatus Levybacteria bacterium RIFCSPHIGHO2_12_FULL_37_12]OGH32444.1 MAG: 30S ribosomal protein S16 [Candidatus Levybacteria bacterium RIFCSPLOWO2_01_FULL_36_54]OGH43273.1 MAG: 30S ribosomal protein S16 [Candidatus Levybacteria bacterium RIFCSPLOWO2_02_